MSRQQVDPGRGAARPLRPGALTSGKLTRRRFVQTGVGTGMFLGAMGRFASAEAAPGWAPAPPLRDGLDPVLWLVHHVNQGFDRSELVRAREMGFERYLEQQLAFEEIDDEACDKLVSRYESLEKDPRTLHEEYVSTGRVREAANDLKEATLLRSVFSNRQLYERMCEFWTDHFNINQNKTLCMYLKTVDDREVIRPHALGNFGDMLRASAHSPAMLLYLDNYSNVASAPNENYARELLELHTLGVDGGYIEHDVLEVARCFTGWTFAWVNQPDHGKYRFRPAAHDKETKSVLGRKFGGGKTDTDGEDVLDMLIKHPTTARFVCGKLTSWLLMYEPPRSVVDRAVKAYLDSGAEIKPVVRAILGAPETLAMLEEGIAPKLRRPYHFASSLLRSTCSRIDDPTAAIAEIAQIGQEPFAWPTPDGYADSLANWGDSVFPRWSFASKLLDDGLGKNRVDLEALFEPFGGFDADRGAAQIDRVLTGGMLSDHDLSIVQKYIDENRDGKNTIREALALAASSPSYQYY